MVDSIPHSSKAFDLHKWTLEMLHSGLGKPLQWLAAWLQMGEKRLSQGAHGSARSSLVHLLCITSLIAAARAGVDSKGAYAAA